MKSEDKRWIDNASYKMLLKRNRFGRFGDPIFLDDTGEYFLKIMTEKKAAIGHDAAVAASKDIGW